MVQSHQQVQVVVLRAEAAHGNGKVLRKLMKLAFDPGLAVLMFVHEQEGAANGPCDAVIPACDGEVHEMGASDRNAQSL